MSFFFRTLLKKRWAASRSVSISLRWLPLTSTSRPSVRGRLVSFSKYRISCGLPSSVTRKSSLVRLGTSAFLLSRTEHMTLTMFTSTLMVGGS